MATTRSIEVKVGLLILTAVVLLIGFILVMGGINFQPTYELIVGFDNPGGLQAGAPVKIAGVKVGKVTEMRVQRPTADKIDAELHRLAGATPTCQIEKKLRRRASTTTRPSTSPPRACSASSSSPSIPARADRPVLEDGAVVRGLDPPRLDRLIAESYDLLHTTVSAIRDHRPEISRDLFDQPEQDVGRNRHLLRA